MPELKLLLKTGNSATEAEKLATALDKLIVSFKALSDSFPKDTSAINYLKNLSDSSSSLKDNMRGVSTIVNNTAKSLTNLSNTAKAVGDVKFGGDNIASQATKASAAVKNLSVDFRDLKGAVSSINANIQATTKTVDNSSIFKAGILGGIAGGISSRIMGALIQAPMDAAKSMLEYELATDKARRTLYIATGTMESANAEFVKAKEIAKGLGQEYTATVGEYAKFIAATKGTKISIDQARESFQVFTSALSAVGASGEDAKLVFLGLTQMMSKGKVSSEELRRQISERLPKAFQLAAESIGVDVEQLDKYLKQGLLTSEEFIPRFTKAVKEAYGEAGLKAALESTQSSVNRLKNAYNDLLSTILESGGKTATISIFSTLTESLKEIDVLMKKIGEYDFFKYLTSGSSTSKVALFAQKLGEMAADNPLAPNPSYFVSNIIDAPRQMKDIDGIKVAIEQLYNARAKLQSDLEAKTKTLDLDKPVVLPQIKAQIKEIERTIFNLEAKKVELANQVNTVPKTPLVLLPEGVAQGKSVPTLKEAIEARKIQADNERLAESLRRNLLPAYEKYSELEANINKLAKERSSKTGQAFISETEKVQMLNTAKEKMVQNELSAAASLVSQFELQGKSQKDVVDYAQKLVAEQKYTEALITNINNIYENRLTKSIDGIVQRHTTKNTKLQEELALLEEAKKKLSDTKNIEEAIANIKRDIANLRKDELKQYIEQARAEGETYDAIRKSSQERGLSTEDMKTQDALISSISQKELKRLDSSIRLKTEMQAQIEKLDELAQETGMSQDEYSRRLDLIKAQHEEVNKRIKEGKDFWDKTADTIAGPVTEAILGMRKSLSDVFNQIIADYAKIGVQKTITAPLMDVLGSIFPTPGATSIGSSATSVVQQSATDQAISGLSDYWGSMYVPDMSFSTSKAQPTITAEPVSIVVNDQRIQGSPDIAMSTGKTSDGRLQIKMAVKDAYTEMHLNGELDALNQVRYGLKARPA